MPQTWIAIFLLFRSVNMNCSRLFRKERIHDSRLNPTTCYRATLIRVNNASTSSSPNHRGWRFRAVHSGASIEDAQINIVSAVRLANYFDWPTTNAETTAIVEMSQDDGWAWLSLSFSARQCLTMSSDIYSSRVRRLFNTIGWFRLICLQISTSALMVALLEARSPFIFKWTIQPTISNRKGRRGTSPGIVECVSQHDLVSLKAYIRTDTYQDAPEYRSAFVKWTMDVALSSRIP